MPLHVSSTCAHYQKVKIALHSLWYHHTYWCDDTRGFIMQFWSPDDEHMCSKHVEAWNKLIIKQTFCASSWLISETNILRCTVSKTSKFGRGIYPWNDGMFLSACIISCSRRWCSCVCECVYVCVRVCVCACVCACDALSMQEEEMLVEHWLVNFRCRGQFRPSPMEA